MGARLKALLAEGKLIRLYAVGQFCDPKLIEMVGWQGGFDAVWLDQEHVGLTTPQLEAATRAARATGLDSFVRLAATDYAAVMRPLEAGAGGVMAAMIRDARQVEDLLNWAKFFPRGMRGVNGTGVDGRYAGLSGADYFARANAETVVAVQIEHRDAVEQIERIAAVPELDFLFIGPADLSQSLGLPGQWEHPQVWAAVERVARAAQARQLPWAILPRDPGHAKRCRDLGCTIFSVGLDVFTIQRGLRAVVAEYADLFGGG